MTVRIAIIGAGVMGADHARIIAEDIPGATVQVICDASAERAGQIAETCAAADASVDALSTIGRSDVDAVLIASPDPTHAELTIAALRHGKPVLCEKPLAETCADCLEVVAAETSIGKQLVQVGFMRRFDPSYREMKDALISGKLGAAVMMHNFHRNVTAPPSFTASMAITNSAPHEFDAARFVLSAEISSVSAFEPAREMEGAAKPVVLVMETSKGQLVTVEVNNNAAYGYDVRGELVGETGAVSLNAPSSSRTDAQLMSTTSYPADWRPRFAEAYRLQAKAWVSAVARGTPDAAGANAWDGYCATAIAEAGAAALASGAKTEVALVPRPPLYKTSEVAS